MKKKAHAQTTQMGESSVLIEIESEEKEATKQHYIVLWDKKNEKKNYKKRSRDSREVEMRR